MKKVVLAVIDALDPLQLEQAIASGGAPALAAIKERGVYSPACVSSFPSVTPVAAASIATGLGPDEHLIPSMNWYHRGEERYVEYGSSFPATRTFGVFRSLQDTVYNMNLAHLVQDRKTIFEHLDDAGMRTAGTTYLMYRGRHRHEPYRESPYARLAEAAQFRHAVWGPRELFYADLYDTRDTGCSSTLGLPGQRDRHAGCVGAHLVENDLFDFLLLSLPDNDSYSHKEGPLATGVSISEADRAIERLMEAGGGHDAFLDEHAFVVMSDHTQSVVERSLNLAQLLGDFVVLGPADPAPEDAELAVCPAARSASVYVLDPARRDELVPLVVAELLTDDGVDLAITRAGDEAVVASARGELRFRPGGDLVDPRGESWTVAGDPAVLDLDDGGLRDGAYPDALARVWSAVRCKRSGEILVSAAPGTEFLDWGGADHVGGGSHGSLHRCDSLGVLLAAGLDGVDGGFGEQPAIRDVTPMVLAHFGVPS